MNIGFGITGSFCTHEKILSQMEKLTKNNSLLPIITPQVKQTDTRFGNAKDFCEKVEKICGKQIISTITEAEPIGPNNLIDVLVVAPCTGNTLAKLALGITDNALTMVAKAHLRNNKPIVIGISSNDALGQNAENLAKLLQSKNFYFVPFGQDDYLKKPKSLVANWDMIEETCKQAISGKQIQPLII